MKKGLKKLPCNCVVPESEPCILPEEPVKMLMDGTAILYEVGADGSNHVIAPTVEKLKEYEGHSMEKCGIAEVEVKFIRWVQEPK